jgi:acetyl-CoA carboxylase carboxyl transferase subunit beta
LDVCKVCGHHFQIGALRRIDVTLDPGTFVELFPHLEALDPLEFKGRRSYLERIREAQLKTGLRDAVVCGSGKIDGIDVVVAVMDFQFIGGSMGSVVGEKITRAIEQATQKKCPVIIVCCSGGARMDEGAFSLMQMAKTSAALHRHDAAGLLCITLLTHPTLAGVSASYAFLGDVIIAEPKAMIGFTGARVIEQTIKKKLPEGFQESEFLLEHGQIDMVVERRNLRDTLGRILAFTLPPAPAERAVPANGNGTQASVRAKVAKAPKPSKPPKPAKPPKPLAEPRNIRIDSRKARVVSKKKP